MTIKNNPHTDHRGHPTSRPQRARGWPLAITYFVLAITGLIGTWWFNLHWGLGTALTDSINHGGIGGYLSSWFANNASSSAAIDLIIMTLAAAITYWRERWIFGRHPWIALLFIPLSLAAAVSFAFPLFLGLRELSLARRTPPSLR